MLKIIVTLVILSALIFGIFGFLNNKSENAVINSGKANMANPASVNCIKQGGTLDIMTEASSGGQIGICNFSDGRSCEEWDFFRTKICE